MPLTDDLRRANQELWERMVTHPFPQELGDGTLPREKFRRYFLQDYAFVGPLIKLVALGVAKAPDLSSARPLAAFLQGFFAGGEEGLFQRVFQDLGVPPEEYLRVRPLPTTQAFNAYLTAVAYDGSFADILTCLLVTEGAYVDWSRRLARTGRIPSDSFYREWIDIHASEELKGFVDWVAGWLDRAALSPGQRARVEEVFTAVLRYEFAFWEMAYHGEAWG